MNARGFRLRVTSALLLLVALAILEALLVLYVQREGARTLDEANRTARILHEHDDVREALIAMQAAQRGYLLTGDRGELSRYAQRRREYERARQNLEPLIVDARQREQFDRIGVLVQEWRDVSAELIAQRDAGNSVSHLVALEASPRFEKVRAELREFEARQILLSDAATERADARVRRATMLTAIGTVVAVTLGALLVALAWRWIRLHLETRETVARLRELDRMKDEFVSIVSHEVRTPLTAIRGSLQLLAADPAVGRGENRELLEAALNNCERLVRLTRDILDISTIEAGRLTLSRRPTAVADVVRHSIEAVLPMAALATVELVSDIPATLPSVMADPDRLTQALVNLLSNAIKFSPPNSIVTVTARADGGVIRLSVQDRGTGIRPEDFARLFHKFERLDNSRGAAGTGLGLAITKGIVEEHGGRVAVESHAGRGTTFTVTVPHSNA